jgi:hypothetical protein
LGFGGKGKKKIDKTHLLPSRNSLGGNKDWYINMYYKTLCWKKLLHIEGEITLLKKTEESTEEIMYQTVLSILISNYTSVILHDKRKVMFKV